MSDEPEVLTDPASDEYEPVDDAENQRLQEESDRRAQLREGLAIQLEKRIPKKPVLRRPQTALTGKDAEKYTLRCRRTDDPNYGLRLHAYNMHRYRVKMIHPVVDTSPPIVARNFFTKPSNFNRRLVNFTRIERENALMVRRIAGILEGRATVDNKLKWLGSGESSGSRYRQMKLLDIALSNLALLKRLQEMKPVIDTQRLLSEYKKREKIMERLSVYPLFWKKMPTKGWEAHVARALGRGSKASVFLSLATETKVLGRVVIELNFEVTPMTCENFLCLCTGEFGFSYKCSQIHRIVPGILWQGGDVTGQEGYGNKSIYGETFPDENFVLKHDRAGVVSMANCGPDSNGSQFIITARSTPALDGTNVVFGKVTAGMNVLKQLTDYLGSTGVPKCDIFIQDCGLSDGSAQDQANDEDEGGPSEDTDVGNETKSDPGSDLAISPDKTNILEEGEEKETN